MAARPCPIISKTITMAKATAPKKNAVRKTNNASGKNQDVQQHTDSESNNLNGTEEGGSLHIFFSKVSEGYLLV